jgi:hypothetical protein
MVQMTSETPALATTRSVGTNGGLLKKPCEERLAMALTFSFL